MQAEDPMEVNKESDTYASVHEGDISDAAYEAKVLGMLCFQFLVSLSSVQFSLSKQGLIDVLIGATLVLGTECSLSLHHLWAHYICCN